MVAVVNESSSGWMNLPKVEVGSSFRLSRGLRQPVEQSSHSKKGSEQPQVVDQLQEGYVGQQPARGVQLLPRLVVLADLLQVFAVRRVQRVREPSHVRGFLARAVVPPVLHLV